MNKEKTYPLNLRRSRQNLSIRNLLADVQLSSSQLIQPYFVYQGLNESEELKALSGQRQHTADSLLKEIEVGLENKINSVLLFIIPNKKSFHDFDYSFDTNIIENVKRNFGHDLVLMTDICLCSHTQDGHCGFTNKQGEILNDPSVKELARKSLQFAQAGVDVLAPSDMMDSRIAAIRNILNQNQLEKTLIMSYSSKFSSHFYGPFREAAQSTPSFGDRKTYQIDPRNLKDALHSSDRDALEGADILMVKPALAYLDIISKVKSKHSHLPLAAYQVSGEYQGLKLMAEHGLLDFDLALKETFYSIKRAGADLIITYGANRLGKEFS